jgi:hypothetical protein
MRGAKRGALRIHHYNRLARSCLAAIQYVAGENPGVPRCNTAGAFAVNPDGVQDSSLVGLDDLCSDDLCNDDLCNNDASADVLHKYIAPEWWS